MSLTYQTPDRRFHRQNLSAEAFVLENRWNLEEVDLDKKLQEVKPRRRSGSRKKLDEQQIDKAKARRQKQN